MLFRSDDDQSIYSWRGADIRNILDFERDWPSAEVVALEQNYRSTQVILDAAHGVVANNRGRKEKRLWTDQPGGATIPLYGAFDPEDESPIVFLRLRKAALSTGTKVYSVAPYRSAGLAKMKGTLLAAAPADEASVVEIGRAHV